MKRWLLAAASLLAGASFASADYVVIIANVGAPKELRTQPGLGMMGMMGMMGMQGAGGAPPMPGGGGAGGPGMMGGQPGGNPRGGAGMMGMQGMGPGMMGMRGMGGAGMMGMAGGGMKGMGGAGMMGMMGMMMGGMMGGMAGLTDVDDVPYFIVAVVEVEPKGGDLYKKLKEGGVGIANVKLTQKKLGEGCQLLAKTTFAETLVLTKDDHKPLPTILHQFNDKFSGLKDKPSATEILEMADWTLAHGLVDKLPQVMDKLIEADKGHPAAVAYSKIKAELDKPAAADDASSAWRNRLLNGYKVVETPHYTLVYQPRTTSSQEIESHKDLLENSFRGFYYWFALKGVTLPLPPHRQLVVMTGRDSDFKHMQKVFTPGPLVVDGFFARRENVAVMASERQDESYDALKKFWKKWEDKGFDRTKLLSSNPKSGAPRGIASSLQYAEPQMVALMLKALENEAELATISHDASRQLLFASGLLPRSVAVPEWLLFGMGSFFETPLQSPWASVGAPSAYYLPRWNELKTKGFERTPGDTLRKVVTDAYFHNLPPEGEPDSSVRHLHDAALRRARTAAWSLTYFLARDRTHSRPELKKSHEMDGLGRYFEELSKMPRDIELDDEILLGCFARAFGCVDANNKVNKAKLDALARDWYSYMENVHFDSESLMKEIREIFRKKLAESQSQGEGNDNAGQGQGQPNAGQGQPFQQPGAAPPGAPGQRQRPGGAQPGGAQPPGGARPGGAQPGGKGAPKPGQ